MQRPITLAVLLSLLLSFNSYSQCNVIPITTTTDGFQITGDYRVYPGNAGACNQIVNPIIIVEGFDPFNNTTNADNDIFRNANQSNLLFDLGQQGFDIITLNFGSTRVPLRSNAALLEVLIDEINAMPSVQNELVVMGLSMGGLIAKYTLLDMESRNKPHNTRMYISMDSPMLAHAFRV